MKFTLNSTNYPQAQQANGAGISIDYSCDQKNKKLMIDIGGEYKGTSISNAQIYTDNKKIVISVPKLYNSFLLLMPKTFKANIMIQCLVRMAISYQIKRFQ